MRLINTSTGAFEEFVGKNIPKYAILSHTWDKEEVSYQDYLGGACSYKKGHEKIMKTLELAKSGFSPHKDKYPSYKYQDGSSKHRSESNKDRYEKTGDTLEPNWEWGVRYAWVDTCCIDKSSSAELSEAINSMYQWYQRSDRCFVYLSDLEEGVDLRTQLLKCRW
jgi:hypothetical protein